MDKEGTKFQNYAQIKEQAALHSRDVATVKQAWPPVGSGEPSSQSAAMWVSLDGYIRVKTVMRFDGNAGPPRLANIQRTRI